MAFKFANFVHPPNYTGMKKLFTLVFTTITLFANAQTNWPDCDDMVVNNVVLANDSFFVTLYNNCTNCDAGIDGPVYCEMRLIRTVAPFDTIGQSDCYCFYTPLNQSAVTFRVKASVQQMPAFSEFQVEMMCSPTGCNIIPFATNVGVGEDKPGESNIYPNPATDFVVMQGYRKGDVIRIVSAAGKLVMQKTLAYDNEKLDVSMLAKGIYIIEGYQCYRTHAITKLIKQ